MKSNKTCVSGKRSFASESIAEQALIQHHIINDYKAGQGPVNVYLCSDCGSWHFTSKGEPNTLLTDAESRRKIELERKANQWERGLN